MLVRPLNRAPVYALLTALLAAVYAGIVLVLGQVSGGRADPRVRHSRPLAA
jgi:hypothetical protein